MVQKISSQKYSHTHIHMHIYTYPYAHTHTIPHVYTLLKNQKTGRDQCYPKSRAECLLVSYLSK